MIHIIRASHANMFELQNYAGLEVNIITSLHPLTPIAIKHTKLFSLTDLPSFPYRRQLFNRVFGGEQWLFGLYNIIKHGDIVHTAETYTPYTHQAVQLRKSGYIKKLICTCWETIPHANEKFARLRVWKQEAYKYVDIFHVPTTRAQKALIIEGVDPKKIVVIPYGVDLSIFHPRDPGDSRKGKKPVVLTVARPVHEKGIGVFEQVQKRLGHICDFRWIYGISYRDMPNVYRQADLFFLPSQSSATWEEQYGMSIVEAMATGLPIVTTSSGAIEEVVGDAGIIIGKSNVEKMVKTIYQILKNKELQIEMSTKSLKRAKKHFDTRQISKQLASLY